MDDRRDKEDERGDNHEDGERDPLDVAVTLRGSAGESWVRAFDSRHI
jgi:hypothetical protein